MGNDPSAVQFARSLVKDGISVGPVVAKALLDHIDYLTRIIDNIEEDKENV